MPFLFTFSFLNASPTRDAALVQRFLSGEQGAQDKLHHLISDLIDRGVRILEGKGSRFCDPENLKQEIIVTIMVKDGAAVLRNFKGNSRLSTYLWSVVRFKLIDKLRQEMVAAERQESLPEDLVDNTSPATELPQLIDRFLNQCSEKDAFILRLRWLEEMDYDSICREVSTRNFRVDKTYIGNLLFKKRKDLLSFLKNEGYSIDI